MPRPITLGSSIGVAIALLSCQPKEPAPAPFFLAHRVSEAEGTFDETRFRSFWKDGQLAGTMTFGNPGEVTESRFSVIPPVPSQLIYHVLVPRDGRLAFDIGVATLGAESLPAPVTFTVTIDEEAVFEETVPRRLGNTWLSRTVDLGGWSGAEVALSLDTRFRDTPYSAADEHGGGALPAWGNPVLSGPGNGQTRPDLILVSIDCLRADHVGAYGYELSTTPALDALADDGVLFDNTVSVSSWTLPTHMSMLTGLMPTAHGASRTHARLPSAPYLPEILSRDGYETIGIVSGLYLSPAFEFEKGFDVYRALIEEPAEKLVAAASERFLAEPHRPRFLFLHFFDAHWPYLPPPEYLERAGGRPPDISKLLNKVIQERPPDGPEQIEQMKTLYDAEVAYIDDQLGRFFDELKRRGLYDDALIIVTADHGEGFYEHELWQHSEIIYNEVTRVPLIVKAPKGAFGGSRRSELVSQLGIFPTLLEAGGHAAPFAHPGLLSLAEGSAPYPESALTEITWEPNEIRGAFVKLAATRGDLKYVATFAGDLDDEKFVSRLVEEELYDLSADPGERQNLLPGGAAKIGSLRGQVRDYLETVRQRRTEGGGGRILLDEALEEKLRALGYVQ